MKKILAICSKQIKDTMRNKMVLFQYTLMPLMAATLAALMPESLYDTGDINPVFATMYTGMVPLSSMTSVIAEERENGTLRCLRMANVTGIQYILGIGSCLLLQSLFGIVVFAVLGGYRRIELIQFGSICIIGVLASLILGAIIGIAAKNLMAATSIAASVSVLLAFLPMMSTFDEKLSQLSNFLYTQQIQNMMTELGETPFTLERVVILGANLTTLCFVFTLVYRKKGLRDQ